MSDDIGGDACRAKIKGALEQLKEVTEVVFRKGDEGKEYRAFS